MGGEEGVCKASGVDKETSEVGGEEGGREAYGVAEKPGGECQGLQGGVGDGTDSALAEGESAKRTATAGVTQESGAGDLSGDMAAGGSKTGKAASAAANKSIVGGRHGARSGVR